MRSFIYRAHLWLGMIVALPLLAWVLEATVLRKLPVTNATAMRRLGQSGRAINFGGEALGLDSMQPPRSPRPCL